MKFLLNLTDRLLSRRLAEHSISGPDSNSIEPDPDTADPDARPSDEPLADLGSMKDVAELDPAFRALKVDWSGPDAAVTACVAELVDDRYAVFAKRGQLDTDIFRAVLARAREADKKRLGVAIYTVDPVVLLTLVRERIGAKDLVALASHAGGRSAVRTGFHDLVAWAVRNGASDLHLNIDFTSPVSKVSATIDGQYVTPAHLVMPTERMHEMARVAWQDVTGGNGSVFDTKREQQGRMYEVIDDRNYMLRWGSFVADTGPSITLRALDLEAKVEAIDLAKLGYLPSQVEQLERAMQSKGGAVVLGGVPGSGKTTTIGQLISTLPETRKIMSMEDPVEKRLRGALQASLSRNHSESDQEAFQSKLMALKRAAASDVLLGEIRDRLTGAAFQDITQSGANCYTTIHVGSALGIPQRLASMQIGIPWDVLGSPRILKLLCYQTLLPVLCQCALPANSLLEGAPDAIGIHRSGDWWKTYLGRIERMYQIGQDGIRVRNAAGCEHCRRKDIPELFGYAGRTVVAELFEPASDPEALRAINDGNELRLHQVFHAHRTSPFDSPDMDGKSAMECAVYKMSQGMIDPRDIEPHFVAFASLDRERPL
ncbi:ATPase, T2SS/T4P/T4SS family [Bordetella petrii]|uniref:ATPase, T2SS/T4P/T4SS family n=1 Tax=Bordetella petrii TaxID=94624 RepID=UPI0004B116AD|nr:ATPase, T2SS/T4P/T4SS family [Bordetella petrii]